MSRTTKGLFALAAAAILSCGAWYGGLDGASLALLAVFAAASWVAYRRVMRRQHKDTVLLADALDEQARACAELRRQLDSRTESLEEVLRGTSTALAAALSARFDELKERSAATDGALRELDTRLRLATEDQRGRLDEVRAEGRERAGKLEQIVAEHALRAEEARRVAEAVRAAAASGEHALSRLDALVRGHSEALDTRARSLEEALDLRARRLDEVLETRARDLAEALDTHARRQAEAHAALLREQAEATSRLDALAQGQASGGEGDRIRHAELVAALQRLESAGSAAADATARHGDALIRASERMLAGIELVREAQRSSTTSHAQFSERLERELAGLARAEDLARLLEAGRRLKESSEENFDGLRQALGALAGDLERQAAPAATKLADLLRAADATSVRLDALGEQARAAHATLERLAEQAARLPSAPDAERLQAEFRDAAKARAKVVKAVRVSGESLQRELRYLVDTMLHDKLHPPSAPDNELAKYAQRRFEKHRETIDFARAVEDSRLRELYLAEILPDVAKVSLPVGAVQELTGHANKVDMLFVCAIAKHRKARRILEFGTYLGRTTYHLTYASPSAHVTTVALPDAQAAVYGAFEVGSFYRGTAREKRITELRLDSGQLDEQEYERRFDFILIDGDHSYEGVRSDSEKAFKMLRRGGAILWHDFAPKTPGVVRYARELSQQLPLFRIKRTSLLMHIDGVDPLGFKEHPLPDSLELRRLREDPFFIEELYHA